MEYKHGEIIKNRYEIQKEIGEGGTSIVYLCTDIHNGEKVVLKISKSKTDAKVQSLDKRFILEAESLIMFSNPNIIKVFEHFAWKNRYVIVMEYLQGKTLKEIMKKNGRIKPRKSVVITIHILNALKDIHSEKIIHRDLKPQNIMITLENKLKLMDFGIVQASIDQDITKTGNVIGTIEYMAPEVIKHEKATPRSEIYSLGICLYYFVTGTMPFKGKDMLDIAKKHIIGDPINPRKINNEVDPLLSKIILKMIKRDEYERYDSAEQLMDVLTAYNELENKEDTPKNRKLLLLEDETDMKKKKLFGIFKKKN